MTASFLCHIEMNFIAFIHTEDHEMLHFTTVQRYSTWFNFEPASSTTVAASSQACEALRWTKLVSLHLFVSVCFFMHLTNLLKIQKNRQIEKQANESAGMVEHKLN